MTDAVLVNLRLDHETAPRAGSPILANRRCYNMLYTADITIIGAGVVGLATAAQVASQDKRVYELREIADGLGKIMGRKG